MRGLLVFLLLVAAGVVALGFYLDWFKLSKTTDTTTNQTHINLTVDKDRIKEDANRAKEKVQKLGEGARDAVSGEKKDRP